MCSSDLYEVSLEEQIGVVTSLPFAPWAPPASIGVSTRAGWLPSKIQLGFLELLRENAKRLHDRAVPVERGERGERGQRELIDAH